LSGLLSIRGLFHPYLDAIGRHPSRRKPRQADRAAQRQGIHDLCGDALLCQEHDGRLGNADIVRHEDALGVAIDHCFASLGMGNSPTLTLPTCLTPRQRLEFIVRLLYLTPAPSAIGSRARPIAASYAGPAFWQMRLRSIG